MGLRINTNVVSLAAQRSLRKNYQSLSENLNRLSSGKRIIKSADDAAGLAISNSLRAFIRGGQQAERNANDGISLVQVAEGGLNEVSNILIRMRELAIQSSSDTVGERERQLINIEYQQLRNEVERLSQSAEYNGTKLLNGTGEKYEVQVGVKNNPQIDRLSFDASMINATTSGLNIDKINIADKSDAQESLSLIDGAIQSISGQRAILGAFQNRLGSAINNLQITEENLSAANSRILDADYAREVSQNAKLNILANASMAALAQANTIGQQAIKLIG